MKNEVCLKYMNYEKGEKVSSRSLLQHVNDIAVLLVTSTVDLEWMDEAIVVFVIETYALLVWTLSYHPSNSCINL